MRELAEPELAGLTTLRLGGRATVLLEPENEPELEGLADRARAYGARLFWLGRGSNLLFTDRLHDLALVSMAAFNSLRIERKTADRALVFAGAGVKIGRLLGFCMKNGLSGLEGLAGIPGTVGGACAMNAGSFGSETGSCLDRIQALTEDGLKWFGRERIKLSYRSLKLSDFRELPLICGAIFALTSRASSVILQQMHLNILKKKSGQPLQAWSAGCAFKNPSPAQPAGRLLEDAGFRGRKLGGMQFSQKHANFLVNTGNGTAGQACELLASAVEAVRALAGIELESEIRIIR